jgi:ubiquitin carboxyl-terminal hydrolase 4/11
VLAVHLKLTPVGDMKEKHTSQLRYESLERLRSSSPAIKRPASDMGAQEREEHTADVDMDREPSPAVGTVSEEAQDDRQAGSTPKAKQLDTGSRHLRSPSSEVIPRASEPKFSSQTISSEADSASAKSSLLPHSDASTTATSLSNMSLPSDDLPPIDDQVQKVRAMASQELQDGQKGFLVSSKWLNRVIAKSSIQVEGAKIDKSAELEEIGPIDNNDLAMVMEGSNELKDEAGKPFVALRPGLTMGDDFQVLPEEAWDLIVRWYSVEPSSPIVTRYAHNTTELGNCQYELHPPIFTFLYVPAAHTAKTQKDANTQPPRLLASTHTRTMKWLKDAKNLIHLDMSSKVRVWRYLGGLKGSGSGILTPAASRSASPAPGAELVATAGDKMLLDVVAFAALSEGDERELLDVKDETANSKYNGSSTLQMIGLGRNDVIILEEQTGGPGGGEWPSETSKARVGGKRDIATSKGKPAAASGRASPAPGIMTRGRQRRDGRPKGITGLNNIGNTCYMNSALQCIRSVEELTMYFLNNNYEHDLNPNNPLSHNGHVAKAYGTLLKKMYEENISSFSPNSFKGIIGKYGPNFSGYGQQDSQEFLLFLLDALAEDLSRIHKKPYIEKPDSTDEMVHDHDALKGFADKNWEIYKARNDSVVTDLFSGMYKSTVTCPICDKVSIIFDPFNSLTLQLPIENNWQREITYFPFQKPPIRIDVEIDKNSTTVQLKEFIAARVKADPNLMVVAEPYRNRFYKMFDDNMSISEYNLQAADVLGVYELNCIPTNYNAKKPKRYSFVYNRGPEDPAPDIDSDKANRLLVPVFHRLEKGVGRGSKTFFAQASYVILDRKDQKDYSRILQKVLGNVSALTTHDLFDEETDPYASTSAHTPEDSDIVITTDDGQSSDSNNVQAHSVEGEDGLVDVSMGDEAAEQNGDEGGGRPSPHPALRPGIPLSRKLQNEDGSSTMFDIRVAPSNNAVPLGWNEFDDNKDYISVFDRIPKAITHRPARRSSLSLDGAISDASSDEAEDIPHDAPTDEGNASDNEELPDVEVMFSQFNQPTKRKQQTYSSKDRRKVLGSPDGSNPLEAQSLIRPGESIILNWYTGAYDACFEGETSDEMKGFPTFEHPPVLDDPQLKEKREKRQSRKKHGISLEDCLNETGKSETLSENNAWYCPRCKEHRRATKKLELWKIPDILVMHLKRFSSNRSFRDKLEVLVDYPVEGLDMSSRVIEHEPGKSMIYDLIAVDMHYGGLGGGHYTASTQNFFDKTWYDYNGE